MPDQLSPSSEKVQAALDAYGFKFEVVELPSSTRTAGEAAASIGCEVGSIAKSLLFTGRHTGKPLLFTGRHTGKPVLVIASGTNRVDEDMLSEAVGEGMVLAAPKKVRELTGFSIGGVPPTGFSERIPTYIDRDLIDNHEMWAAAGTPFSVFRLTPDELIELTKGEVIRIS